MSLPLRILSDPWQTNCPIFIPPRHGLRRRDPASPTRSKAVVAEFDAGELITQRGSCSSQRVQTELVARCNGFGYSSWTTSVSPTHLRPGVSAAVEAKQVNVTGGREGPDTWRGRSTSRRPLVISAEGDTEAADLAHSSPGCGRRVWWSSGE